MYEQTFNLASRPFTTTPFVKHYFAASAIKEALAQSRVAIDRGSGPVVVIGECGTGKSLLLAMLDEQYHSQYRVVTQGTTNLPTRADFLQAILFELQQPYRGMSESEMRLSLIEYLKPGDRCPNGILLLVDDADRFEPEILDEVRLITNFVRNGQPRIRLVMTGTVRLEESLTNPKLESFTQRIASRSYLSKLSREETLAYIRAHIERAGGNVDSLFNEEACKTVHELSDGSPRFINQICDHSMIMSATRGAQIITSDLVNEAWADVQNLPGAWQPNPQQANPAIADDENWTVLEFGSLDDDGPSETVTVSEESAPIEESVVEEELTFAEEPTVSETPTEITTSVQETANASDTNAAAIKSLQQEQQEILDSVLGQTESEETPSTSLPASAYAVTAAGPAALAAAMASFTSTPETKVNREESLAVSETVQREPVEDQPLVEEPVAETTPEPTEAPAAAPETQEPVSEQTEPASYDNPFEDDFADEEVLTDAYSPFVAQQNRNSLSVSQEAIKQLTPIDGQGPKLTPAPSPEPTPIAAPRSNSMTVFDTGEDSIVEEDSELRLAEQPVTEPSKTEQPTGRQPVMTVIESGDQTVLSNSDELTISQPEIAVQPVATQLGEATQEAATEQPNATETTGFDSVAPADSTPAPLPTTQAGSAQQPTLAIQSDETPQPTEVAQPAAAMQPVPAPPAAPTQPANASEATEPVAEETTKDDKVAGYHVQAGAPNDDEIRRQAEEIIRGLQLESLEAEVRQVSHETAAAKAATEAAEALEANEQLGGMSFTESADQPQEVLQEIMDQQELLQSSMASIPDSVPRPTTGSPDSTMPMSIQYPTQQPTPVGAENGPTDDRDMLIVSRSENSIESPKPDNSLPEYAQQEPSKGRAERIDYQSLFDQLRNISDD